MTPELLPISKPNMIPAMAAKPPMTYVCANVYVSYQIKVNVYRYRRAAYVDVVY